MRENISIKEVQQTVKDVYALSGIVSDRLQDIKKYRRRLKKYSLGVTARRWDKYEGKLYKDLDHSINESIKKYHPLPQLIIIREQLPSSEKLKELYVEFRILTNDARFSITTDTKHNRKLFDSYKEMVKKNNTLHTRR